MFDIILAVCCLIAGLCAGIKFSERYTEKFKFYKSISIFNERLYTENARLKTVNICRKNLKRWSMIIQTEKITLRICLRF